MRSAEKLRGRCRAPPELDIMHMRSKRARWTAGLALGLAGTLSASEYRGTIRAGGLPLPGATVTAELGAKKQTVATDERGAFRFADLSDGTWTLEVEMIAVRWFMASFATSPHGSTNSGVGIDGIARTSADP